MLLCRVLCFHLGSFCHPLPTLRAPTVCWNYPLALHHTQGPSAYSPPILIDVHPVVISYLGRLGRRRKERGKAGGRKEGGRRTGREEGREMIRKEEEREVGWRRRGGRKEGDNSVDRMDTMTVVS